MREATQQRIWMAGAGALGGQCLYVISEVLDQGILSDRLELGLAALAGTFFAALLAASGPLSAPRAVLAALAVALPTAGLLVWASLRFDTVGQFMDNPLLVLPAFLVAFVPLPFLMAAAGPGWRNYPALFTQAWNIVVRYAAAWLFVGLAWAVIFLSDKLLGLVGLTVIQDLIDLSPTSWIVTGFVLGLSMAVVTELSDIVSPFLILRLLRLLLPVVLLVMLVFILALPIQGLSHMFGELSAAATLLVMVLAGVTLVSTAIDQNDNEAIHGALMRGATRMLALLLPVPAALAGWAVWLRIDQYGLTPGRLAAAFAVALAFGYGLLYAGAALRRRHWMARIRRANTGMALVLTALSVLWLTPVLDAQRISAENQVARFADGRTSIEDLDLRLLERLGRAGAGALAQLEELGVEPGPKEKAQAERPPKPDKTPLQLSDAELAEVRANLRNLLPLRPGTSGAMSARDAVLAAAAPDRLRDWLEACEDELASGLPACAMVVADFLPKVAGDEAMFFYRDGAGSLRQEAFLLGDKPGLPREIAVLEGGRYDRKSAETVLNAVQADTLLIEPAPLNALIIEGQALAIIP